MAIWAKSNGVSLKDHINCLLTQAEKLKSFNLISEDIFRILKYAILLHDIGKVSPSFQMAVGNSKYKPKVLFPNIPHSIFSLIWIDENSLRSIFNNKDDIRILLSSVAFHHWRDNFDNIILGKDPDVKRAMEELLENTQLVDALLNNLREELGNSSNLINFNRVLADILKEGYNVFDYLVPPYKNYYLPGRLIIDESAKRRFILVSGFLIRIDHFASYLQQEASESCDLGDHGELKVEIEAKDYEEVKRSIVGKVGSGLWQEEKLGSSRDENLILVAPTGSGKSEFAFLWGAGAKLFFTLPLRSAVNAMYERAKEIFDDNRVGLLHSDADVYLYETTTNYEGERMRVLDMARHLAYPVLVTTGDQIFPSALKYPGYEKIYATLSYSKLVVDEVQAYNPKAIATIIKLLEDVVKLGGKFLLMTATLPNFVKEELKERIGEIKEIDIYKDYENVIKHKISLREEDLSEKVEEVIEKAKEGKRILVIFNTVGKAQKFYKELKKKLNSSANIYVRLLHSRFTLEDRKNIEKEVVQKFSNPKPPDESEPRILVATQVVEASLDIDADILYTELAPIDALIQRMGRVMRRCRKGKCITESDPPNVYILSKNPSGVGKVYLKKLLEISKEELKKFNERPLPEQGKKELVESLYAKENRDKLSEYFSDFYDTLNVLDAGFVSEYKEEALRIFREIYSIPVIPKGTSVIEKLKEAIRNFCENNKDKNGKDKSYTSFKSQVLSKFVVHVDLRYLRNNNPIKVSSVIVDLDIKDENSKLASKILRWLDDIYLIDAEYDEELGLNVNSKAKEDDNII